jgi:hypothetical protein
MRSRQGRGLRVRGAIVVAAGALAVGTMPVASTAAGKKDEGTGAVKGGVTYTGVSSQGAVCGASYEAACEISLRISKKGTRATVAVFMTRQSCDNGSRTEVQTFGIEPVRIVNDKLNLSLQLPASEGTDPHNDMHWTAPPSNASFFVRFTRTGRKYVAKGDLQYTHVMNYEDGSSTTCTTGPVTFTLRPG